MSSHSTLKPINTNIAYYDSCETLYCESGHADNWDCYYQGNYSKAMNKKQNYRHSQKYTNAPLADASELTPRPRRAYKRPGT